MIEEAAGTRLYESKKEAAQKTIEKKDAKLKEIDSVICSVVCSVLADLEMAFSKWIILRCQFL